VQSRWLRCCWWPRLSCCRYNNNNNNNIILLGIIFIIVISASRTHGRRRRRRSYAHLLFNAIKMQNIAFGENNDRAFYCAKCVYNNIKLSHRRIRCWARIIIIKGVWYYYRVADAADVVLFLCSWVLFIFFIIRFAAKRHTATDEVVWVLR